MVVPLIARWVAAFVGALLVLSAVGSVVGTLIVPRAVGGWLTRWVDRVVTGRAARCRPGALAGGEHRTGDRRPGAPARRRRPRGAIRAAVRGRRSGQRGHAGRAAHPRRGRTPGGRPRGPGRGRAPDRLRHRPAHAGRAGGRPGQAAGPARLHDVPRPRPADRRRPRRAGRRPGPAGPRGRRPDAARGHPLDEYVLTVRRPLTWSEGVHDQFVTTDLNTWPGRTWTSGSGDVEPIDVHDLVPRGHEVTHELLLGVVARVDLRDGSELGVRTEDEVDGGGGTLDLTRGAIPTLEQVLSRGGCLPLRAHVEQVHEEVVGQRLGPVGVDAVLGLPVVG